MERCLYEGRTFLWTFIVGHLARLGSRNAMDANRSMTQRKWVEVSLQKLVARGIAECVRSVPVGIPSGGLSCPEQAGQQGLVAQNRMLHLRYSLRISLGCAPTCGPMTPRSSSRSMRRTA